MRAGRIILICLIVIGGFLLLRHPPSIGTVNNDIQVKVQPRGAPKEQIIEVNEIKNSPNKLEAARRSYNAMVVSGVTRVPGEVKGDKLRVSIFPNPQPQACKSGDFDLVKALAPNATDKFIVVSLETLKRSGQRFSDSFSLAEMGSKKANFDIPLADGAYGLYVCTDPAKAGACSKKGVLNPKIWTQANAGMKKNGLDKVFYFQLLEVKDGNIHIIPSAKWGKDNIAALKTKLKPWMGGDVGALEPMNTFITQLQPMPARLNGNAIEIPLPFNDLKCLGH